MMTFVLKLKEICTDMFAFSEFLAKFWKHHVEKRVEAMCRKTPEGNSRFIMPSKEYFRKSKDRVFCKNEL